MSNGAELTKGQDPTSTSGQDMGNIHATKQGMTLAELSDVLKRVSPPQWKDTLRFLQAGLMDTFPTPATYEHSQWSRWVKRIELGAGEEHAMAEGLRSPSPQETYEAFEFDPVTERHAETHYLTQSMYAALIVCIWSQVERFILEVVTACEKAVPAASNKKHNLDFSSVGVISETLTAFSTINATRILNNSFKHSNGNYVPGPQSYEQIEVDLLNRWGINPDGGAIAYETLPVEEIVVACNAFCDDLAKSVESGIEARLNVVTN